VSGDESDLVAPLERFSQLYISDSVAAVPNVVPTLIRREEREGELDEREDLIEGAWARGSEERFEFGKRLFDRIEVRAVGRQKPDRPRSR
jgi:hypothetical protein